MKSLLIVIASLLLLFCGGCDQNKTDNANLDNKNNKNNVSNVENKENKSLEKTTETPTDNIHIQANIAENENLNFNEDDEKVPNLPNISLANEIPNKWSVNDKWDSFPLIDFRNFKSINNNVVSEEEKNKEAEANKIYEVLVKRLAEKDLHGALVLRGTLESKHHNTQASMSGAFRYAEYLASTDKDKAVDAYEWILVHWPESHRKWTAISRLQELKNMYLYLYSYGNYHHPDSTNIRFQLSGSNIKKAQAIIYKVDLVKMVEEGLNPQAPSVPEHGEEVAKWDIDLQNNNGNWSYQQINMPKLGQGHYVLSINSNFITVNSLFSTSNVSLLTKSDDRMLLCWAKDKDNRSVKNSKILVLKAGKIVYRGNTNESGLFAAQMKMRENDSDNLHVIVDTPHGQAISGSYYYWYNGYHRRIGYAYTDRPIYRPGQKVNFKGVFRERKPDNSIVATPGDISLIIYNQQWEKVSEQKFTMDSFGAIHGEYLIPEKAKLGQYYMQFSGNYYAYIYFQVEEYKKPEYEVFVNAAHKNVLQSEKMEVTISSKYYFGEPVKEADVEYEVYESGYWYDPYYQENPWYWFCEDDYYYRYSPYYSEQLIHRGTGKLDESGHLKINVDTRENKNNDLRYRVRASVIDKSRRKIDGSTTFLATRSNFTIAIKTDRWSYKPGETVKLHIQTQDYDRKGIATPIVLKVTKSRDSKNIELINEKLVTNEKGIATYDWVVDENGHMSVYVEAKDEKNRLIYATRNVWVADNTWRSPYTYNGLNIELEKTTYTEGEEVRGIITTGYANSWMLTTTESERMEAYELVKLNGGVYPYNTIAAQNYQPYVNVYASMMENNTLVQATKKIVVPPTQQFLNVSVAREASYQPGQKAEYTIKITDSENKPVVAQFSFGLVDEAIYSMRAETTPDIRKAFHMENRGTVRTNTSYRFYSLGYGGRKQKRDGMGMTSELQSRQKDSSALKKEAVSEDEMDDARGDFASNDSPKKLQKPRVRTEFADSAVWEPSITTNEMGIAKVTFTMPDNLTTWRATIRGITMSGKVGETLDKVITRKNLMARLECPRTFTEQDKITISGVIHNYLAQDVEAVCRLKATGATFIGNEEQKITLKSGEDKRVDWTILVTSLEKVTLELEALTTEESDAMRLDIPVVPYGLAIRKSDSGVTDSNVTFSFDLPESTSSDRAHLVVSVKPTLAGSMLESLEYLAGYPYGCVEQTMSRFLPSVIVAQTLQNLQMEHEKLQKELPLYVEAGTKRLVDFQHSDGGWGWWQNDATNPLMTAYVIYGFSQAQRADYSIDKNVMSRGIAALKDLIEKEQNFEHKCYMVFAYSQVAKPNSEWVDDLYAKVDEMTDYCRALLLMMAQKSGSKDIAQDLLTMLEKNVKNQGAYCYFEGKTVRYGWTDNPIETTAYCLKAIVSMNPKHPLIPKILKWLEIKKQGKHYQSTKDTAAVVFAFSDYLAHSNELNPNYNGNVTINGVTNDISFKGKDANTQVQEFKVAPQIGKNTITIHKNGLGKIYYTAYIEYYSKEKEIPAVNSGIGIERAYFQLTEKKNENGTITYERSPMGNTIKQGEIFEVELTLSAARSFDYLMLQDYIPAGCEFEKDKDLNNGRYDRYYYWSNKEYRDDRLVVFFGSYHREQKITYRLRAETPGIYNAMPARIEMMYYPEITSNTTQSTLHILESR